MYGSRWLTGTVNTTGWPSPQIRCDNTCLYAICHHCRSHQPHGSCGEPARAAAGDQPRVHSGQLRVRLLLVGGGGGSGREVMAEREWRRGGYHVVGQAALRLLVLLKYNGSCLSERVRRGASRALPSGTPFLTPTRAQSLSIAAGAFNSVLLCSPSQTYAHTLTPTGTCTWTGPLDWTSSSRASCPQTCCLQVSVCERVAGPREERERVGGGGVGACVAGVR